jgi:phosphatidylethanolamine-binding protein (PEBP) family uncharacterized protein
MKKNMKTKKNKLSRTASRNKRKNKQNSRVIVGGNVVNNNKDKKANKDKNEKDESLIIYYSTNIISNNKDLTGQDAIFNKEPNVAITNSKPNKIYMITMTDPDAPNGEGNSNNFVHTHWVYVIVNKKIDNKIKQEKIIFMPYSQPTPPSGTHRYQFNLYDISNKTVDAKTVKLEARDLMVLRLNDDEKLNPDRKKYSDNLESFLKIFKSKFAIQYKVTANKTMSQISASLKSSRSGSSTGSSGTSGSSETSTPLTIQNEQQQQLQQQQEQINQLQKQQRGNIGLGTFIAADIGVHALGNLLF